MNPVETKLGLPDYDNVRFQFRLWNSFSVVTIFTQLTLTADNEWKYRTGFLNHNAELTEFENSESVDVEGLWQTLDSLGVRELKSQDQVTVSINRNGVSYKLTYDEFENFIGTGGAAYQVELFYKGNYRTYYYLNPIKLSDSFKKSKEDWIADEHHSMAEIVRSVNKTFDLIGKFKEYLKQIK